MIGGRSFPRADSIAPCRPASAGIGLQAVRLHGGPRAGLHAGERDREPRRSILTLGRMGAGRRAFRSDVDDAANGAANVKQPRSVQLLRSVGIPQAVDYAQRLTVETPPSVPSLALGAGKVTLASLTSAYGAFANGGIVHDRAILRVEDGEGQILYQAATSEGTRAISEATAFQMAMMLADVINAGTAYRARREGFVLPAAGKTGTTNDYMDAWFVGFTPSLVSGVWIGFDQPRTIVANGYAGDLADAALGAVHGGGSQGSQARVDRASEGHHRHRRVPHVWKDPVRRLSQRRSALPGRER